MLRISVVNQRQDSSILHDGGPLELGRAQEGSCKRLVIADPYVSRDQLRVEERPSGQLHVVNLGGSVALADGDVLVQGEERELELPVGLWMGRTRIEIVRDLESAEEDETLCGLGRGPKSLPTSLADLGETPSPQTLAVWFETVLSVQRAAAGSAEFYEETARAVVDLVGLDCGLVLLREGAEWRTAAACTRDAGMEAKFSHSVLARVLDERRTFYQRPAGGGDSSSLLRVEAVVAAPIFDPADRIEGVVYGSRDLRSAQAGRGIQPLEAQVVQLLAGAVSAGLARVHREAEAARLRVQFEQFFSPELVGELERNPRLLEGRDREITVLFGDIRGFSGIAERLGARDTYRLASDVMDRLTNRVLEQEGVIVDYHGDGLAAMWNAPGRQPLHAAMACRAASAIQEELPALNEKWRPLTEVPLRIGVGVHTGVAQVGNAGSRRRLKYGPRGHTVNLASRIEGATKQLGAAILVSGATRARLGPQFATRRLCRTRFVGVAGDTELYELHGGETDAAWRERRDAYERALALYETGRFSETRQLLDQLLEDPACQNDAPIAMLRARTVEAEHIPAQAFDPVFQLGVK